MDPILDKEARGLIFCEAEFKAGSEAGVVEGMASTFQRDLYDDVVDPGAFKKTVSERVPAGRVPLFDSHVWNGRNTLGTVIEAMESEHGLPFKAKLSSAPSVQDIKVKMLEGHLKFVSIGFSVVRATFEEMVEKGAKVFIRHLQEVILWEISVVPIPANEGAKLTLVKDFLRQPSLDRLMIDAMAGHGDTEAIVKAIGALAEHVPVHLRELFFVDLATRFNIGPAIPAGGPAAPPAAVDRSDLRRSLESQFQLLKASMELN